MGKELKRIEEEQYEAPEIMVRAVTARHCIAIAGSTQEVAPEVEGRGDHFEDGGEG